MPIAAKKHRELPETMIAAAIDRVGPPEVLTGHSLPVPDVGPSEILIALHGTGVGSWDAKIRDGTFELEGARFPLVLGVDGAGVVIAKGSRVRRFDVGDRVWAYSFMNAKGGFYAEYVVVDAHDAGHVPTGLDLVQAGVALATALTAQQGIDDHLHPHAGDPLLVFGASGAVGTYAVQIAKARGAHVIATASGETAQRVVRELGADEVIDARDPAALARLPDLAAVLALAGGEALERCVERVRAGGKVAYPNGVEPPPSARDGIELIAYDAIAGPRELTRLAKLFDDADLRVTVAAEYPLAQASAAHRRLAQGHVIGRIGLRIRRRGE